MVHQVDRFKCVLHRVLYLLHVPEHWFIGVGFILDLNHWRKVGGSKHSYLQNPTRPFGKYLRPNIRRCNDFIMLY